MSNKSKYLRDKDEKGSKYLRTKNEEEKPENEEEAAPDDYRKSVITPKRARELFEEEQSSAEAAETLEEEPLNSAEAEASKDVTADERKEEAKQSKGPRKSTSISENRRKAAAQRRALCIVVLTFFAVVLYFIRFHVPFTPRVLSVEFATVPELIASIAYGPLVGVAICLFKDVLHAAIYNANIIADLSNLLLDSVFIVIAGLLYSRSMFHGDSAVHRPEGYKRKDYRRKRILKSSLTGALISLVPQFFITRYISFPLLERFFGGRGFDSAQLLSDYQNGMAGIKSYLPERIASLIPGITNLSRGIIVFNLTVSLFKMLVAAVITAIIYKHISAFLHNRQRKKH